MFDAAVSIVLVSLASIVVSRRVFGWWRARRARRDAEAWQRAFDACGGSRVVFGGYDQAQGLKAKKADQEKYLRRFRRARTAAAKARPADVVTFRLRGSR